MQDLHSVWRPKVGHAKAHKYTIRVNVGSGASDLVRVLPTATHTVAQVKHRRDKLVEEEVLRLRTEWLAAGHQLPLLQFLGSVSRYRKKRAGSSKNVGTERKVAHEWKKIQGKKTPAPRRRQHNPPDVRNNQPAPAPQPKAQPKRRPRQNNAPAGAPQPKARPKQGPRPGAQRPAPKPKARSQQRHRGSWLGCSFLLFLSLRKFTNKSSFQYFTSIGYPLIVWSAFLIFDHWVFVKKRRFSGDERLHYRMREYLKDFEVLCRVAQALLLQLLPLLQTLGLNIFYHKRFTRSWCRPLDIFIATF